MSPAHKVSAVLLWFLCVSGGSAVAEDISGRWTATGYVCGVAMTEIVQVYDNGDDFQGIKVTGDKCVTAGAVTFFGSRKGVKTCKLVIGSESAPNSGTINCPAPLVVTGPNAFTIGSLSFKRSGTITVGGDADRLVLSVANCRNVSTSIGSSGTLVGNSGWTCKNLKVKRGDTVVMQVTGTVQ